MNLLKKYFLSEGKKLLEESLYKSYKNYIENLPEEKLYSIIKEDYNISKDSYQKQAHQLTHQDVKKDITSTALGRLGYGILRGGNQARLKGKGIIGAVGYYVLRNVLRKSVLHTLYRNFNKPCDLEAKNKFPADLQRRKKFTYLCYAKACEHVVDAINKSIPKCKEDKNPKSCIKKKSKQRAYWIIKKESFLNKAKNTKIKRMTKVL